MDVLITPDARQEIKALRVLRPEPSTWGILIGHKRGSRFIVERVFPAGNRRTLPDERILMGLDGLWPGRTIGLFAVRPRDALRRIVLGPAWYGKLILLSTGPAKAPVLRSYVVEFKRIFSFDPVPLVPAAKEDSHE